MNKTELSTAVAERTGMKKKDAVIAVSAMLDIIIDQLTAGEKIQLVGFGSFEVKHRAARTGHNPMTGAEISIPATKSPTFKASKNMKDVICGE